MSRPNVEEITITMEKGIGGGMDEVQSHPAFGQVSISRTSGGRGSLYGSDFDHMHRVTFRVKPSTLRRHHASDWHHSSHRGELIEFDMSEAQFATMVSSINMGEGVPCTLRYINGKAVPDLPEPRSRSDQFGSEMQAVVQDSMDRLDALMEKIGGLGLSAKKADALRMEVRVARDHLKSNAPFIAGRFDEHMEETTEKAKQEVHGYMTSMVTTAGLHALSNSTPPVELALSGPKDSDAS